MSILSDELNYLVYRYLQESGFQHSAFIFAVESNVMTSNINGSQVPPGALVAAVQKGLQYVQAEIGMSEDGNTIEETKPVSLIHSVSPNFVSSQLAQRAAATMPVVLSGGVEQKQLAVSGVESQNGAVGLTLGQDARIEVAVRGDMPNGPHADTRVDCMDVDVSSLVSTTSQLVTHQPPLPAEPTPNNKSVVLRGHEDEVFICAWNPVSDILASGSGDSTARLWDMRGEETHMKILHHVSTDANIQSKDVTTLEWNRDGALLATGFYDGQARIWSPDGTLLRSLVQHQGPIFAVKWNRQGNYIVTVGIDKTAIVWEAQLGEVKQQFAFHQAPILDVDWQNNTCFASCSADKDIHVCRLGLDKPVKTFKGHLNDVNTVKWNPNGTLLASCSDDTTVKIWSLKQDACIHSLQSHQKEIYTIQWSPTGLLLASASFDATTRVWDVEGGSCIHVLSSHQEAVYAIAFSPDGQLLASGSLDSTIRLWAMKDGQLLHTYSTGAGTGTGVFEVCWNHNGSKLAGSCADCTVCCPSAFNCMS
jgi:transducin (beta)-like 1